jgi:hypothetical protein
MKVFISYGSAADQVTALRLQALGAVNGLTVYVPPAYTRQAPFYAIDPESAQKITEADVMLGVVGMEVSTACWEELRASKAGQRRTIVMAGPQVALQLQPLFGSELIVVDPARPDAAEWAMQHLKNVEAGQPARDAIIALGAVTVGLLLLAAFAPQD